MVKNELVQLEPDIISLNIVEVVENILSFFQQTIYIKRLTITKKYYSNDAYISGDEKMIKVIIQNILSNAVKFTKKNGAVYIRIHLVNIKACN